MNRFLTNISNSVATQAAIKVAAEFTGKHVWFDPTPEFPGDRKTTGSVQTDEPARYDLSLFWAVYDSMRVDSSGRDAFYEVTFWFGGERLGSYRYTIYMDVVRLVTDEGPALVELSRADGKNRLIIVRECRSGAIIHIFESLPDTESAA